MGNSALLRAIANHGSTLFAVGLALVTAWMGGGTQPGAQVFAMAGLGIFLLLDPPPRFPDRRFLGVALGLILLAGISFLPADWFRPEPWRERLTAQHVALSAALTAQPWISAESLLLLAFGLVWIGCLTARSWSLRERRLAMQTLAGGVIGFAAVALANRGLDWHLSGWLSANGLGPFPNRNHFGDFLALGGVLATGCGVDAFRHGKRGQALAWTAGVMVIVSALAGNSSRGGILMFLGALALWSALAAWRGRSWKVIALGWSTILVIGAVLLIWGGPISDRFASWIGSGGADSVAGSGGLSGPLGSLGSGPIAAFGAMPGDFRRLIWADTFGLLHAGPWCGIGLGNFASVFRFFRIESFNQQTVIHPESDWLWLAVEMGWMGVGLVLVGLGILTREAFPSAGGMQRCLRGAAVAGAMGVALHGVVDVPGHRLGCVLIALLSLALARWESRPWKQDVPAPAIWRGVGLFWIVAALWWAQRPQPGLAEHLSREGRLAEAIVAAETAAKRAPLDWRNHFTKARALALGRQRTFEAAAEFRRARALEPGYVEVPMQEGLLWARLHPALALPAWEDALRRVSPPQDENYYTQMLAAAPNDVRFREQLLGLAEGRPKLELRWLRAVPPVEVEAQLARIRLEAQRWEARDRADFEQRAAGQEPK